MEKVLQNELITVDSDWSGEKSWGDKSDFIDIHGVGTVHSDVGQRSRFNTLQTRIPDTGKDGGLEEGSTPTPSGVTGTTDHDSTPVGTCDSRTSPGT